ncbi:hypothetical protein SAMN05421805_104223 [Saccharopolyspora antimicrobica]|uniref:PH domain-containing protein n=1 Tax=Saccharopolyspora antimicrobica TaxID=455193 RepID=A0A1I4YPK3_9PSEU|nr:hypothetical protein [Saccharopolyspora antimicrobica]RKT82751.1 hypothetical protein ATL45_1007 [Saccharopolyspora antimicrobica]SFN39569.1 hypothetical protein SAMN05421805_104223 [Saccharopolyspora antimicrobica]
MITWLRRLGARLSGTAELPADFAGELAPEEHVLAVARTSDGALVATHLGLWLPEGRRIGWHLLSKATWKNGALTLVEAEETGDAGGAVLLRDQPDRRLQLTEPRRLPDVVHERVNKSIRSRHHRDLPGGGAWFVQRKVPGQDGIVLQVRPDRGADEAAVAEFAATVAEQLNRAKER